jgi:hypothetical protein
MKKSLNGTQIQNFAFYIFHIIFLWLDCLIIFNYIPCNILSLLQLFFNQIWISLQVFYGFHV